MFLDQETAVQFLNPVLTADEIEELMLLLQPDASPNSGLTDNSSMDEDRKRKRMISNRESARRSRWRKKRHLEGLTSEAERLRKENRELRNRVGLVANRWNAVRRENERLRSESVGLCRTLSDLHRIFRTIQ